MANASQIVPAPLQRRSAALVVTGGHLKQLWGLDRLVPVDEATYRRGGGLGPCEAACLSELFGLALAFLGIAFRAMRVRATNRLRDRWSGFDRYCRRRISREFQYAYQSPSSNRASFWTEKAVFLWRLVTKTAKTCWAVCSGDMSGLYIGPG